MYNSDVILVSSHTSIGLNLQMADGELSLPLKVKAMVRDSKGDLLEGYPDGVWLEHKGGGLFKNTEIFMPDIPEVTAQFFVHDVDGYLDEDFGVSLATYLNASLLTFGGQNNIKEIPEVIEVTVEEKQNETIIITVKD